MSCDKKLPAGGPYYVINDRPWCDDCAAPYVEAATTRRGGASVIRIVAALAVLAVVLVLTIRWFGLAGGAVATLVAGGVGWRVLTALQGGGAVVDVQRLEGGKKRRLGPES